MHEQVRNEKGLTLVEILASIVILSIVLMTFLLVFSQTAKTTKQSEGKIDATYIAQTEMEHMYEMSRDCTLDETHDKLSNKYQEIDHLPNWTSYEKEKENQNFRVIISFDHQENSGMTRILIEVESTLKDDRTKAQMENLYKWKG